MPLNEFGFVVDHFPWIFPGLITCLSETQKHETCCWLEFAFSVVFELTILYKNKTYTIRQFTLALPDAVLRASVIESIATFLVESGVDFFVNCRSPISSFGDLSTETPDFYKFVSLLTKFPNSDIAEIAAYFTLHRVFHLEAYSKYRIFQDQLLSIAHCYYKGRIHYKTSYLLPYMTLFDLVSENEASSYFCDVHGNVQHTTMTNGFSVESEPTICILPPNCPTFTLYKSPYDFSKIPYFFDFSNSESLVLLDAQAGEFDSIVDGSTCDRASIDNPTSNQAGVAPPSEPQQQNDAQAVQMTNGDNIRDLNLAFLGQHVPSSASLAVDKAKNIRQQSNVFFGGQ